MSNKNGYNLKSHEERLEQLNYFIAVTEKEIDFCKYILSEKKSCEILRSGHGSSLMDVYKHPGCDNMSSKDKRNLNKSLDNANKVLHVLYERKKYLEEVIASGGSGITANFDDPDITPEKAKALIGNSLKQLQSKKAKSGTTQYDKDIAEHECVLDHLNKGTYHPVD